MTGTQFSAVNLESLIDMAILEIEVAPSLRARARENLQSLAATEGREAIEHKIQKAQERKERAKRWISRRRSHASSVLDNVDSFDMSMRMWEFLRVVAERKDHQKRAWAGHVKAALQAIDVLDEKFVRSYPAAAETACAHLLRASEEKDFSVESSETQAMIFAEAGNLWTMRGIVTNEREIIRKGLSLYGTAAKSLTLSNAPVISTVVQFNRGVALRYYIALVAKEHIEPLNIDVSQVISHFSDDDLDVRGSWSQMTDRVEALRDDLSNAKILLTSAEKVVSSAARNSLVCA